MGKIYIGRPLRTKNRRELITTLRPNYLQYLRADNGDLPETFAQPLPERTDLSAYGAAAS